MTDWDVSQRYTPAQRFLLRTRPSLTEAVYLHAYPELLPHWQGPVDPHQARIADNAMADLGGVLLNQAEWELEQIDRRNGF
jgi:hypothetical protein